MKTLPVVAAIILATAIGSSCSSEKKEFVDITIDYETTPTMKTINVETLISDSGVIRYKITAPVWLVFEEAKDPRWNFSEGLHLEKYDNAFKIDAQFDCDSAKYLSVRKLWRFDGSVHAMNVAKDRFDTELLFWDQRDKKVYTDSFIHISLSDRIIEGYGFVSNENMTEYTVNRVSGIFPVNENRNDSTETVQEESKEESRLPTDSAKSQNTTQQIKLREQKLERIQLNRELKPEKIKLKPAEANGR